MSEWLKTACGDYGQLGRQQSCDKRKPFARPCWINALAMPDRLQRADLLQRVMRIWLVGRPDTVIGAYWPIKGEFDPLTGLAPLERRRRAAGPAAAAPHRLAGGGQACTRP